MEIDEELATCKANLTWHQDRSMRYIQTIDSQRERIGKLENCIRELLKGGEHEGECGNDYDGDSDGPCLKHVEASNQRDAAARKLLEESNGTQSEPKV